MPGQIPREVVTERFQRLMAVVDESALGGNRAMVGTDVEVLVASGEGRKDEGNGRLSGRARDGRLVHFTPDVAGDLAIRAGVIRPGDVITTTVTAAAPHHLLADGGVLTHRRTRAGDRFEAGSALRTPGVGLGMPGLGRPAVPSAPASACSVR
jgi:tRNA-2-methylthio-N6-dimethylallyladenosine synthase